MSAFSASHRSPIVQDNSQHFIVNPDSFYHISVKMSSFQTENEKVDVINVGKEFLRWL